MSVSPVLSALRAATSSLHAAVEADADVENRLRDHSTRASAVSSLLAFHEAVERVVGPWRDAMEKVDYAPGDRSALIRADLEQLGGVFPAISDTSQAASLGEAVGWTYVAEGSMLGGRVMRKGMIADGIALTGLDFLDPYGDETGLRWKALLSAMESVCDSGQATQEDIVRGGRDAFELAYRILVPPHSLETH